MSKVDCSQCEWKRLRASEGEHCYMFRVQLTDTCTKFKQTNVSDKSTEVKKK